MRPILNRVPRARRQKALLLAVAGKRKTGKDVLVDYVMKNYPGFKHYRIAEAPTLIAKILELPPDRRVQQALFGVNKLLYPILGESVYKRRVAKLLDREKPKRAIVEAIRTKEEYEEFVVRRGGVLIGVTADDRLRYRRALRDASTAKRGEKRDEGRMTFKQFMARENLDIERDIDWIIKRAHFILVNNHKNKKPFYGAVEDLMRKLKIFSNSSAPAAHRA